MLGFLEREEIYQEQAIYRRTDYPDFAGGGGWAFCSGCMPQAQLLGAVILSLEGEVWRHGRLGCEAVARA